MIETPFRSLLRVVVVVVCVLFPFFFFCLTVFSLWVSGKFKFLHRPTHSTARHCTHFTQPRTHQSNINYTSDQLVWFES